MSSYMITTTETLLLLSGIVSDKRLERTSTSQAQQPVINEVKHYFQKLPQGYDSDDPLDFWIESEKHYSKLALFAMDLLCIPASTTLVECVFSTAGYA